MSSSLEKLYQALTNTNSKVVVQHWIEARGKRGLPGWHDLNPRPIARQLPHLWAFTYNRPQNEFVGRLAGQKIEEVFGKSFRGISMSQLYPSEEFPHVFDRCKRVVDERAIFHSRGRVFSYLGRAVPGERIILPLGTDGTTADGVLGITSYSLVSGQELCRSIFCEDVGTWFEELACGQTTDDE